MASIFVTMRRDVPLAMRDPVFERLERQMDDLVERLLRRPTPAPYSRAWAPRLDIYETAEAFVIVAELADVDTDDVTIEVESEYVTLTGTRAPASPPQGAECLQLEVPFGAFERRLQLPEPVDATRASADLKDGMLTVSLPKLGSSSKRVQVGIQRTDQRSE
jgi:HSP20 family protein